MTITPSQVKEIRNYLDKAKPATVTLQGNRPMTMKEVVYALAPTLERMKKRGFLPEEIIELLRDRGIDLKTPTLAKYLSAYRREKSQKKSCQTAVVHKRAFKKVVTCERDDAKPQTQCVGPYVHVADTPDYSL
ncbi:MAG: protein MobC [Desulfovibrio sp.]|nr:protein MobC [Desulfovibrio sp.]